MPMKMILRLAIMKWLKLVNRNCFRDGVQCQILNYLSLKLLEKKKMLSVDTKTTTLEGYWKGEDCWDLGSPF